MTPTLIIFGLVLLNGLFVAAEFALIAAPKPSMERLALEGSRAAQLVSEIMRDPRRQDRYIATAQLGITIASLGLGMYGEHVLARALEAPLASMGVDSWASVHGVASVLSIALLTFLHIVIGEMVPKTLAIEHAAQTALWINGPMQFFQRIWWPLVVVFEALGNGLLRMFGVSRVVRVPSAEDLQSIVEESVAEGQLGQTGHLLKELFEFSERSAGEVMTPRVKIVGLAQNASAADLRRLPRSARHSRYPVYEGTLDRIVGMVTIRDVLELMIAQQSLPAERVRPVPFVPATARLEKVLSTMREHGVQLVVVMDEHGGTAGIVTMEDLTLEVVGPPTKGPGGAKPVYHEDTDLRAFGLARLDEVGEQLGVDLDHPEVDSVSGLVLSLLDRPAKVGDTVKYKGVEFTVLSVEGHGVKECSVVAPDGHVVETVRPGA